jgi:U3 small nucleolar ribonucleoprotein component
MELKKLMVDTKEVWVDFPGLSGFSVKVANLSRKELNKLRKRCITQKFDRKSRQVVEELDEEKFVKEFSIAVVKDWKGLKLEHLETILLINTDGQDMSKELEYSEDNAEILVSQSTEFDTWLNEVVFDLDNFRSPGEGRSSSAAGEPVQES